MSESPGIPYLQVPELTLIPKHLFGNFPGSAFTIKPFGTLVALGVCVGYYLAMRQAKRLGMSEITLASFVTWVVGIGFVGGHVFDVIFYYPDELLNDPLSVLRIWESLSSFGGFTGAVIGVFAWKWRYKTQTLPYADVVVSAFPSAWVFGRGGCSLAHDHPGLASDAWFAVQYPGGGRFDLGLCEMVLTIPLALAFLWLRRRPRPWGFYCGAVALAYAPIRFALDFLRLDHAEDEALPVTGAVDPRYGGLTPAQWACFALLLAGVFLFARALRSASRSSAFAPPAPPPGLALPARRPEVTPGS